MKQILHVLLLSVALMSSLYAQDVIYTSNGSRLLDAHITDLTDDRVTFTVQQTDKLTTHSVSRKNVLVAFRKGNYLIIDGLSTDLVQAKHELQIFQTTTVWSDKDYLLKAIPFEVIPAKISYENDAIVNYLNSKGQSASIPKGELIGIFYSDGRHALIRDPVDAVPFLANLSKPVGNTNAQKAGSTPVPQLNKPVLSAQPDHQTQHSNATPTPLEKVGTASPTTQRQPNSSAPAEPVTKMSLSETERKDYQNKAIGKVEQFSSYLNIITNKSLSIFDRNQAINQAALLFMPAATIEVTSNSRAGARRYPIRTYLNNLKLLPYNSTKIEWTEVNYLKELSQANDGNYYGIITGQQSFIGYGDNTTYSDITPKNVRVKLERYHMTINGQDDVKWNLLLGSIGVSN